MLTNDEKQEVIEAIQEKIGRLQDNIEWVENRHGRISETRVDREKLTLLRAALKKIQA